MLAEAGLNPTPPVLGAEQARSKVEKIQTIAARHPNAEIYYVGDTRGDILEARQAGAKAVGAAWGWHGADRLRQANPDFIAESLEELEAFLR